MVDICEHDIGPSISIEGRQFLNYSLLKDCAP